MIHIGTTVYVTNIDDDTWEFGHGKTDYDEEHTATRDELLELAHLLIKEYRRAQQKEEMGL